jgi:hypothetical protein
MIRPKIATEKEPEKRLTQKELAKQYRHEAYLRAKEYSKTDPRQIVMKEKQKKQRKEAYQKGKERRKDYQDEIVKKMKEKTDSTKIEKLKAMIVRGSTLKKK